ncbi:24309_t:CDS:2, partial [Dentiscutata erythropus]
KLSSFIETRSGPGFVKSDCLYFYKEGLHSICKSSEFDDEQKTIVLKLIEKYKVDKKKCAELLKAHENQVIAHSIRSEILKNKLKLLVNTARSANSTIYMTFTQADEFIRNKRDLDNEVDDVERTIVGGKSTSWVVNGISICQRLTEYQETGFPKTKPEYYDTILFTNKNQNGFLETLEENVIVQMHKEIKKKDEKTENNIEKKIKSFLNNIITQNIKKTKENLKLQKNDIFEEDFAKIFDMSEGTFIAMVLAPILN